MNISFTLNGSLVSIKTPANRRTSQVLQDHFQIQSIKTACAQGSCGNCIALINEKLVLTCILPAFSLRDKRVITVEGLTDLDEYQDIKRAQEKLGLRVCQRCESVVMLTAQSILQGGTAPTRWDIMSTFEHYSCSCSTMDSLVDFIQEARSQRRRRRSARRT